MSEIIDCQKHPPGVPAIDIYKVLKIYRKRERDTYIYSFVLALYNTRMRAMSIDCYRPTGDTIETKNRARIQALLLLFSVLHSSSFSLTLHLFPPSPILSFPLIIYFIPSFLSSSFSSILLI